MVSTLLTTWEAWGADETDLPVRMVDQAKLDRIDWPPIIAVLAIALLLALAYLLALALSGHLLLNCAHWISDGACVMQQQKLLTLGGVMFVAMSLGQSMQQRRYWLGTASSFGSRP